ncbi:ATPase family AAA domain-containing protein 2 [Porphyridium purpureum]|uniref:ATPase family AAA domain-containing protein 2 n=1 Tax=Porphyridium purpureum TaxID=35688 RepID=A0A5J4YV67_PORPP|nr:ATPase family AAA domain-containing protein 2 [Porphyridium purpureum]|eukprot:POR5790..scf227_4
MVAHNTRGTRRRMSHEDGDEPLWPVGQAHGVVTRGRSEGRDERAPRLRNGVAYERNAVGAADDDSEQEDESDAYEGRRRTSRRPRKAPERFELEMASEMRLRERRMGSKKEAAALEAAIEAASARRRRLNLRYALRGAITPEDEPGTLVELDDEPDDADMPFLENTLAEDSDKQEDPEHHQQRERKRMRSTPRASNEMDIQEDGGTELRRSHTPALENGRAFSDEQAGEGDEEKAGVFSQAHDAAPPGRAQTRQARPGGPTDDRHLSQAAFPGMEAHSRRRIDVQVQGPENLQKAANGHSRPSSRLRKPNNKSAGGKLRRKPYSLRRSQRATAAGRAYYDERESDSGDEGTELQLSSSSDEIHRADDARRLFRASPRNSPRLRRRHARSSVRHERGSPFENDVDDDDDVGDAGDRPRGIGLSDSPEFALLGGSGEFNLHDAQYLRGVGGAGGRSKKGGEMLDAASFRKALDRIEKSRDIRSSHLEPLRIETHVGWDSIGGLDHHVRVLKEMVYLPMMYPELFAKFMLEPPKGVLFCGPPGTGKTLTARALASACGTVKKDDVTGGVSRQVPRVSFFMRNGADVLSKWVGEAERNLRLTFEAARQNQPAIIFFDEIDGLAPVRSSKQDQIHSSIVSTLLALMDGIESRGQIVVIGATNRPDAIDPALRRPGRFDRELVFSLPNRDARLRILQIHTRRWQPAPPDNELLVRVASATRGFCGADLQSLCGEAALQAIRRRFPQVYNTSAALSGQPLGGDELWEVDPDQVAVTEHDFDAALSVVQAASMRAGAFQGEPLCKEVEFLLQRQEAVVWESLQQSLGLRHGNEKSVPSSSLALEQSFFGGGARVLIRGVKSDAQCESALLCPETLIAKAVLLRLDEFSVVSVDLCALHASEAACTSLEDALGAKFAEARRAAPAVILLKHLDAFLRAASPSLKIALRLHLSELPINLPLFVLATISSTGTEDEESAEIDDIVDMFTIQIRVEPPSAQDLHAWLTDLCKRIKQGTVGESHVPGSLPIGGAESAKAVKLKPRQPAKAFVSAEEQEHAAVQMQMLLREEEVFLRQLRIEIREYLSRILRDARFKIFARPVDPEDAPDYYEIIKNPVDLSLICQANDNGKYITLLQFVQHIDVLVQNAVHYNPPHTEEGALILRRAHGLLDFTHAWADSLDAELVAECNQIYARRCQAAQLKEKDKAAWSSKPVHSQPVALSASRTSTTAPRPLKEAAELSESSGHVERGKETKVPPVADVNNADGVAQVRREPAVVHTTTSLAAPLARVAEENDQNMEGRQDQAEQKQRHAVAEKATQEDERTSLLDNEIEEWKSHTAFQCVALRMGFEDLARLSRKLFATLAHYEFEVDRVRVFREVVRVCAAHMAALSEKCQNRASSVNFSAASPAK